MCDASFPCDFFLKLLFLKLFSAYFVPAQLLTLLFIALSLFSLGKFLLLKLFSAYFVLAPPLTLTFPLKHVFEVVIIQALFLYILSLCNLRQCFFV